MTPQEIVAGFLATRFRAAIAGRAVGFDDPLISTGIIDSFGLLEVIAFLEDSFHVTIDPTRQELTEFDTVNKMLAVVDRARAGSR